MRINNIHIDRFGALEDFDLALCDGFNLVFGENESGKTTVMSFIRLMFYGDGSSANDIIANLRQRYLSAGGCGGRIDFFHEGTEYSLSKRFGKTTRTDKVSLFDKTRSVNIDPPEGEIGEYFFSIGAGAFEQSIFIGSSAPMSKGGVGELTTRLSSEGENEGYEKIEKRLSDALYAIRSKNGTKGSAAALEGEINSLKRELSTLRELETHRMQNNRQIEVHSLEISRLTENRKEISKKLSLIRESEKRTPLVNEKARRDELKATESELSGFSGEDCSRAEALLEECSSLSAAIKSIPQDDPPPPAEPEDLSSAEAELEDADSKRRELSEKISALEASSPAPASFGGYIAAAAVSAVGSCALSYFISPYFLCGLILAAVFAALAAKASAKNSRAAAVQKEILSLKEARIEAERAYDSSKDRYQIKKNKADASAAAARERREAAAQNENRRAELIKKLEEKKAVLAELLGSFDIPAARALLSQKREKLSRRDYLLKTSYGDFSALDDPSLEAAIAAIPEQAGSAEECERELARLDGEISRRSLAVERLKTENEGIFRGRREIGETERLIAEKTESLADQNEYYNTLRVSLEALAEAQNDLRQVFAPELNKIAGELFEKLTAGRYSAARIQKDFSASVDPSGESLPFDGRLLSSGGRDQLDLCVRLAVSRLLSGGKLPLLLDDSLSLYDDRRTRLALEFLCDYSRGGQTVLFTCHEFQKAAAESAGADIKDFPEGKK